MRTWPDDWEERRRGAGCPACAEDRPESIPDGERFYAGRTADAYLVRRTSARGYSLVFWRGRHVADPTELDEAEWTAFAAELRFVAQALESVLRPAKLNIMLLGNTLPHLHAHLVPRYVGDPDPESPPTFMLTAIPEPVEGDAAALLSDLREAVATRVPTR